MSEVNDHLFLVCYDIQNDRKRTKIADLLMEYGYERLQYSVFVGLQEPSANERLWDRLTELVPEENDTTDRLLVIRLLKRHFKSMQVRGHILTDLPYICGELSTLVI
ncbi:MAG: CRISPR-associated endonuclease Cas2 [Chitinophagales bacterium]|nr:CRISPR-associated endonuclease Cas2 [Chitinophagales bacterium]